MINHFPTVFGTLVVLAALAAPANAADTHIPERPAVATLGNTAEAEAILGAKLLVCNTCHGDNGLPKNAATPVIWGLQENYLLKQLHDFQRRDRDNDVMTWMATALSQAELGPAAAYFAKKNWPARRTNAASASPLPPVDTLPISLETTKLVGECIRAEANLKLKIRNHGRQSWIQTDLAA